MISWQLSGDMVLSFKQLHLASDIFWKLLVYWLQETSWRNRSLTETFGGIGFKVTSRGNWFGGAFWESLSHYTAKPIFLGTIGFKQLHEVIDFCGELCENWFEVLGVQVSTFFSCRNMLQSKLILENQQNACARFKVHLGLYCDSFPGGLVFIGLGFV